MKEKIYSEPVKFKNNILSRVSTFIITFDGEHYKFDEQFETILINNLKRNKEPEDEENGTENEKADAQSNENNEEESEESLDGNIMFPDLPEFLVKNILPEFIFFEGGECDTLPDFISIENLINKKNDG